MWLLVSSRGAVCHLLVGKEHLVGRREGDLILADDQSVSRKHAIISVQHDVGNLGNPDNHPVVRLTDCSSKYGIFINDGIEKSIKMSSGSNRILYDGDRVRFGLQWNVWRFEYKPLVVTTSTLTPAEKKKLKEHILKLGGHLVPNWQESVTHVTMGSITLTVKVVCALAHGKHIVTPQFWEQYIAAVSSREPVPDCKNFIPPLAESTLNVNEVSFHANENRKRLFLGKKFMFFSEHQYKNYSCMIQAAGGNSYKVNEFQIDVEELVRPNVIVMQYSFPRNSQDSQIPDSCQQAIKYLRSKGRRAVPESEIGLAILYCSLEKNCNPDLKVVPKLLTSESRGNMSGNQGILALDTQLSEMDAPKEKIIIPDSGCVPKEKIHVSGAVSDNTVIVEKKPLFCITDSMSEFFPAQIKRERISVVSDEVDAEENPRKRKKVVKQEDISTNKALKPFENTISITCIPEKKKSKEKIVDDDDDDDDPFKFPDDPPRDKGDDEEEDLFRFHDDPPTKSKDSETEDLFAFSQNTEMPQFEHAQSSKKRKEHDIDMEPNSKKRAVQKISDSLDNYVISSEKKETKTLDDTMTKLSNAIRNVTVVEVKPLISQKLFSQPSISKISNCSNFKKFKKVRGAPVQHVITTKDMVIVEIDRTGLGEPLNGENVRNDDKDDDFHWAYDP